MKVLYFKYKALSQKCIFYEKILTDLEFYEDSENVKKKFF